MIDLASGILQHAFMRNALMAGALVSVACGVIGTFVVVKRIVFVSGGIAHAAYGGIGLGYYFQYNILPALLTREAQGNVRPGPYPLFGAVIFSLVAAFLMGWVQRKAEERADTVIGAMWAIGMAIGIIFVDLTAGYKADLMSYLFGSILAVPTNELWLMLALDLVILALAFLFYKELLAVSFDEDFAIVENVPVDVIYGMLLSLIALTVVMMMRVVGLIMVIALLTIPAAISGQFVRDMKKMMILSSLLGIAFSTAGLLISYTWNLTSGATIILISGAGYLLSLGLKSIRAC